MPGDPLSENPYRAPVAMDSDVPSRVEAKSRHGCATAFLYFMVIANSLVAVNIVVFLVRARVPVAAHWRVVLVVLNVLFLVALLRWKRWGFYGIAVTVSLAAAINFLSEGLREALLGLVGLAVLYGVLQIGGKRSTWSQLE